MVASQQFDDTLGRGRHIAWQTYDHAPHIDGGETINVLARVDTFCYLLRIDVCGQGQLHNEAVNRWVLVEPVYTGQEFCLRHIVLVANE